MRRGAVFFDRDGVLNRDVGYAHRSDQIEWTPGVAAAVAACNGADRWVFVVTNQSGVARGFFDEAAVKALHLWMAKSLAALGARIDDFAYCPDHPEGTVAAYARTSDRRKPGSGMIEALIAEHDVDRRHSFLIGDKASDLAAARAAAIPGLLFEGGDLLALVRQGLSQTA